MKKLLLLLSGAFSFSICAQTPLANATLELTLTTAGGTNNRSGLAYNPNQQLYYSVNAGSSGYPGETYDAAGNQVNTVSQGFDFRGAWWNPNTNQFEGNGYSSLGIWVGNLTASYYLNGTGTTVLSGSAPDPQSCGDYDYMDDEILYYNSGSIYRYSRATNTFISSVPITGLAVSTSNLNWNSVAYTGIPGMEAGVYDYVLRKFYFINKNTGAYVTECVLPGGAPASSSFQMSFEAEYLWLYSAGQWNGYKVLEQCSVTNSSLTISACSSYLSPAGNTYITSGMYTDTIPNAAGCDSLITIDLTIQNTYSFIQESACGQYISPGGNTYTSTGVYYDTIPNAAGCDSIVEIDLSIVPNNIDNSVTVSGATIQANQLVAAYQWLDCNGFVPLSGEVNQYFTPSVTGSYAVEITVGLCTDTSECVLIDFTGIEELMTGPKELVKIFDLMGRETEFQPNVPLIYLYSDGTRERRIEIE